MDNHRTTQTPTHSGDPAQAFAALCAEVAAVRQTVTGVEATVDAIAIPDYSPSLAAIVQGFAAQGERLAMLEQRGPAAERALDAAGNRLAQAARETEQQRRQLSDLIGRVHERREQRQWGRPNTRVTSRHFGHGSGGLALSEITCFPTVV
jgi:uncharacterized coiled-coil protein SlyX